MDLTISNIEFLKRDISKAGLTYSHLMDDMIDHVCCDVEYEMQSGLPFEKAYEVVKEKIGVSGLKRVQEDTLFLIDKNYRTMKKLMKISGLIAPILIALGALFKIEHWVGAGILLVLGFFTLSFLFLPSAIYISYKEVSNKSKLANHIAGFIGFFLLAISFLFKVMHWPGAGWLMFAGIIFVCLVFLPIVVIYKIREKSIQLPTYVIVLASLGMIFYLLGFFFKTMHWPGAAILLLLGAILLVFIALPLYVFKTYKDEQKVENSFIYLIVVLVWLVIPTMLITLNVSQDVARPLVFNAVAIEADLDVAKAQEQLLLKKDLNEKSAANIHQSAADLIGFIQKCKADIVKEAESGRESSVVSSDNSINMHGLSSRSVGDYNMVMFNTDKKIEKLKAMLLAYQTLIEDAIDDETSRGKLKDLLSFDFGVHIGSHEVTAVSLNRLSLLQLAVLNAEKTALVRLENQVSKTNVKP